MKRRKHLKRKYRQKNRFGLYLLLGIALLILFVLFLPQFRISSIEAKGLRVLEKSTLLKYSEISHGDHLFKGVGGSLADIFSLRHSASEEKILDNCAYVKSVSVRSVFPGKILIDVTERVEVAYIAISDGFVIADSQGIAVEVIDSALNMDIPVIEGIQVNYCKTGEEIIVDMPEYFNQSLILLNHVINSDKDTRTEINLLDKIKSIRPVNDRTLFMIVMLAEEELVVKIKNSENTFDDMLWMHFAIEQDALSGKGGKILDLTTSQRAFR